MRKHTDIFHGGNAMSEINEIFEDAILAKLSIEKYIKEFDPEIQQILYKSYGKNLEDLPKEFLNSCDGIEKILEQLLKLGNTTSQKIILMRFGIMIGTPMMLEEVAKELGITRERVRQIESRFLTLPLGYKKNIKLENIN